MATYKLDDLLAWVVALARLEVGAVLATYTDHPRPFHAAGPSRYERAAYREPLEDAMHTHLAMLPRSIRWDLASRADSRELLRLHRHLQLTARLIAAAWSLAPPEERPRCKAWAATWQP